ncbi:MAG: hypothetical protein HY714_00135 [Candidatus Omnitrophica bacterium]|nr:hypothetical protein [Candidatus Omnitrophota bacterium]
MLPLRNVVVVLWVLASTAYTTIDSGGAYSTYKQFVSALFTGKFDQAAALADGKVARGQVEQKKRFYGPATASYGFLFRGTSFSLDSHTRSPDGKEMKLTVTQLAKGDQPGVTSAFGTALVRFDHQATLVRTPAGWRVKTFRFKARRNENYPVPWMGFE